MAAADGLADALVAEAEALPGDDASPPPPEPPEQPARTPASSTAAVETDVMTRVLPLMSSTVPRASARILRRPVRGPEGAGRVTGVGSGPQSTGKVPARASPGHVLTALTVRLEAETTPRAFDALGRAP